MAIFVYADSCVTTYRWGIGFTVKSRQKLRKLIEEWKSNHIFCSCLSPHASNKAGRSLFQSAEYTSMKTKPNLRKGGKWFLVIPGLLVHPQLWVDFQHNSAESWASKAVVRQGCLALTLLHKVNFFPVLVGVPPSLPTSCTHYPRMCEAQTTANLQLLFTSSKLLPPHRALRRTHLPLIF